LAKAGAGASGGAAAGAGSCAIRGAVSGNGCSPEQAATEAAASALGGGLFAGLSRRCPTPAAKAGDEGIVYLRTDKLGSKPYVGQSKSAARYDARQVEHARENPFADFEFSILGRAKPGAELDRLEEFFIRGMGGPTTRRNPSGVLANRRHQMSDRRYQRAGGAP
jgi:hypothetical protein